MPAPSEETVDMFVEEQGKSELCASFEVCCECYPGEERTWDYPGSGPTVNPYDLHLQDITGETWQLDSRDQRPDWWDFAEACLKARLLGDPGFEETVTAKVCGY